MSIACICTVRMKHFILIRCLHNRICHHVSVKKLTILFKILKIMTIFQEIFSPAFSNCLNRKSRSPFSRFIIIANVIQLKHELQFFWKSIFMDVRKSSLKDTRSVLEKIIRRYQEYARKNSWKIPRVCQKSLKICSSYTWFPTNCFLIKRNHISIYWKTSKTFRGMTRRAVVTSSLNLKNFLTLFGIVFLTSGFKDWGYGYMTPSF